MLHAANAAPVSTPAPRLRVPKLCVAIQADSPAELLERALRLVENIEMVDSAGQPSLVRDLRSELAAVRNVLTQDPLVEEKLSAKV